MTYRTEHRDRSLRLPIGMLRGNEFEKEKIESIVEVLRGELAAHLREIAIAAADFFTSDDIRWFLSERGLHGADRLVVFTEALTKFRQDINAARRMMEAADAQYALGQSTNRMPAKVANR